MTHTWTERTTLQNKWVNWGLYYLCKAAAVILAHPSNGGESGMFTILQGSYNTSVGASAGTHAGPDALDITPYNIKNRLRVFRILGFCLWHRTAIPKVWAEHMHGVTDGGAAAKLAQQQVDSYHHRRNGLANNGWDTDYKMLVFPKFVFPEKPQGKPGPRRSLGVQACYEQPTIVAPKRGNVLQKGEIFTVVAVVNVEGSYWGIDAGARCVPMTALAA